MLIWRLFSNSKIRKHKNSKRCLLKIKLPKKRTSFFFFFFQINTNCLMNQVMGWPAVQRYDFDMSYMIWVLILHTWEKGLGSSPINRQCLQQKFHRCVWSSQATAMLERWSPPLYLEHVQPARLEHIQWTFCCSVCHFFFLFLFFYQ